MHVSSLKNTFIRDHVLFRAGKKCMNNIIKNINIFLVTMFVSFLYI